MREVGVRTMPGSSMSAWVMCRIWVRAVRDSAGWRARVSGRAAATRRDSIWRTISTSASEHIRIGCTLKV